MNPAALVIGIDKYPTHPLSSAANDSPAFKKALIALSLVDGKNIFLITAPQMNSQQLPTRENISNKLHEYYKKIETDNFFNAMHKTDRKKSLFLGEPKLCSFVEVYRVDEFELTSNLQGRAKQ